MYSYELSKSDTCRGVTFDMMLTLSGHARFFHKEADFERSSFSIAYS